MSHLKLQKLLFYCDAWNLALRREPLINGDFEAWVHGPVNRQVWDARKSVWQDTLTNTCLLQQDQAAGILEWGEKTLIDEEKEIFNDVLDEYGKQSDYHLEKLTHSEAPWVETRGDLDPGTRCTRVIPKDRTGAFYAELLYGKTQPA